MERLGRGLARTRGSRRLGRASRNSFHVWTLYRLRCSCSLGAEYAFKLRAQHRPWPIRQSHLEEAGNAAYRGNGRTVVLGSKTVMPHPLADCGATWWLACCFCTRSLRRARNPGCVGCAPLCLGSLSSLMRIPWRGDMWCCIAERVRVQTAGRCWPHRGAERAQIWSGLV